MVNEKYAKKFCRDDISKIENYEEAINDISQTWHCHHRDEVKILPSGIKVTRTKEELIENGRYFNCPANELIFLRVSDHLKLHVRNRTKEQRNKIRKSKIGNNYGIFNTDKPRTEFGKLYFEHYGYSYKSNKKQYRDSYNYWMRNNHKLLWEKK